MSISDEVRSYCVTHYLEPARHAGAHTVTIRAGDVHAAMELRGLQPLVCVALGSDTFECVARVRRLAIDGPIYGANTLFVFRLDPY